MVQIVLNKGENGYDKVLDYIKRYNEYNIEDDIIATIGCSYDGKDYCITNELAMLNTDIPYKGGKYEWEYDWWEGERYIRIYAISSVSKVKLLDGDGIYE